MIKRHFLESKDHLIDKLYNLDKRQKEEIKAFFKKHPNYENKIDWNNRDLKYRDFRPVLDLANKSKSAAKKTGLAGLVEGTDYKFFKSYDYYNVYQPLTHWGSKVLASNKVGVGNVTGQWCISMNTDRWWSQYIRQGRVFFFMIGTEEKLPDQYKKIAICYDTKGYNSPSCFDATDRKFSFYDFYAEPEMSKVELNRDWEALLLQIIKDIRRSNPKDMGAKLRAEMEQEAIRHRANIMADFLSSMTDGESSNFGWNYTFRNPKPENLYVKVLMLLDGNKQMRKVDILSQLYVNEDIPSQTAGVWERDENGRYHKVDHKPHTRDERAQYFHIVHHDYYGSHNNAHGYESNLFTAMRNAGLLTYNRNRTWSWGPNAEPYVQYWNLRQRFEQYKRQHPEKEY